MRKRGYHEHFKSGKDAFPRTKVVGAVPETQRAAVPAVAARKAGRVAVLSADPTILYVFVCDV